MLNVWYVMKVGTIHSYEASSHDLDTYNNHGFPPSPIGATALTGSSQTDKVLYFHSYLRNVNDDRQYT